MAINFPNSPSSGDTHTVSGKIWQWDGEKWKAYGASIAPGILKIDTANNRVGINQTTPTVALDVTGGMRVTGDLTIEGTTTTIESTTIAAQTSLTFEGATADDFETTLTLVDPTADRTITLPNNTGTVALTSDLSTYATLASPTLTGVPAAPTAAADTNTTQIATTAYVQTELGAVSSDSIADADSDTKIQVEEGSDEDIIRFDTAGTERMTINADGTFSFAQGLEDSNVVLASQVFR
tara:strand:- start:377 stop:1090 length:714 start_codon:yes stop_codon:yes gene_type:complete